MKGVELPINVLVIVAIAIIVLLGLVALYFIGFPPFTEIIGLQSIKNVACGELNKAGACTANSWEITVNYDANKDDEVDPKADTNNPWNALNSDDTKIGGQGNDNLAALCYYHYNVEDEAGCKRLCACPGY
ncbi:MAG: hypothetical protein ACE5J4_03320 [Candidatus Aenigmatarchaeota archaeon]